MYSTGNVRDGRDGGGEAEAEADAEADADTDTDAILGSLEVLHGNIQVQGKTYTSSYRRNVWTPATMVATISLMSVPSREWTSTME